MNKPKITIITITYNSEKTVEQTFASIRRQRYDPLEYLVIDGGSTDSTLQIAERYRDTITTMVSEQDYGISDAMNKGVRLATGDLIGIIHSDDMLAEGTLDILAKTWDGITEVYYGNAIICDEAGNKTHVLCATDNLSKMPYSFVIVHPATFVTKTAYEKYGLFDRSLKCAMDYDLLLRFYKLGAKFKYINENLAIYRTGGTNMRNRRTTVDEICNISIRYGGKPIIANWIRIMKQIKDKLRPLAKMLHYKNKRVKKI